MADTQVPPTDRQPWDGLYQALRQSFLDAQVLAMAVEPAGLLLIADDVDKPDGYTWTSLHSSVGAWTVAARSAWEQLDEGFCDYDVGTIKVSNHLVLRLIPLRTS